MTSPPEPEDIRRCQEVLEAIVADRSLLAGVPEETRIALLKAAGRACHPTRREVIRLSKELRARERHEAEAEDRKARSATVIRKARQAAVFSPACSSTGPQTAARPRSWHGRATATSARASIRSVHFFYDSMCPACGDFNYHKRFQTARPRRPDGRDHGRAHQDRLSGRALMLLRAGAQVVATTRFPHDAALRYSREQDFAAWSDRLQDPRPRPAALAERGASSAATWTRPWAALDILINNAAQTVRRPAGFLRPPAGGAERSTEGLPPQAAAAAREPPGTAWPRWPRRSRGPEGRARATPPGWRSGTRGGPGVGLRASARSRRSSTPTTRRTLAADAFPAGRLDADLQQVDLRAKNSWRLTLAEVPTAEMLELQLINSVAPFILCSKLKRLMLRRPQPRQAHRQRLGHGGELLARHQDRQAPAHQHGQGRAQHADADLARRTTPRTAST